MKMMKKRTREDKKRAEERRITYLSTPSTTTAKKEVKINYGEFSSNKDLIKSLVVSLLMFFILYLCYRFWR
jgi:hypothetical protein